MSELALDFSFGQSAIRTIIEKAVTWFALIDICNVLDLSNPTMVANQLDDDERAKFNLGRQGEAWFVNEPGLYHVILTSRSEKAKPFRRWVTHEVLPSIRQQGFYTMLTREKTIELLTQKQREDSTFLDCIDKQKIKRSLVQEVRDAKVEETRQVWFKRFTYHEEVDVPKELRSIWAGDMPMYHKYLDQFHSDENRERKGQLVTI